MTCTIEHTALNMVSCTQDSRSTPEQVSKDDWAYYGEFPGTNPNINPSFI